MRFLYGVFMIVIVLSFAGCANANVSRSREAFILSQPHGWIEIEVLDSNVPAELPSKDMEPEDKLEWELKPPLCFFIVKLNNEEFLSEPIFPFDEEAPYEVDTGFRFPAPIGEFELIMHYRNCDMDEDEMTDISFTSIITIDEDMVTSIFFDGDSIEVLEKKENDEVTLEDIYDKLNELDR